MEPQKDNKQSQESTNGHFKNNAPVHYDLSLIHKDKSMSFIQSKTQNICLALHLVTEFMPDSEPLRTHIRRLSLSAMIALEKDTTIALLSATSLAGTIGLISSMNTMILVKELQALLERLSPMSHEHFVLSADILGESFPEVDRTIFTAQSHKGHTSSHVPYNNQSIKDKKVPTHSAGKSDIALRLARRNTILKIIKDKKNVSVKDVSSVVSDFSEKTIQRELQSLVSEGVLKKIGLKRWSKYSFA